MKKLDITWDGIHDSTGYLFSLAKSLACAIKYSPWPEYSEDIIATSGFAFRMWVADSLCPSATSIWEFAKQKEWLGNGGLTGELVVRLWGQDNIEEEKRLEAISNIKRSIDLGIPAISWDIGVPEWGLITGYNDQTQVFDVLATSSTASMPYDLLGKRELPILSVLTITGKTDKSKESILSDTKKLAAFHLSGQEWADNAKGLKAYPSLIRHFPTHGQSWEMEYMLGTYAALKYYAWKYFEKMGEEELARIYKDIHYAWQEAFGINRGSAAKLLQKAYEQETYALEIMEGE